MPSLFQSLAVAALLVAGLSGDCKSPADIADIVAGARARLTEDFDIVDEGVLVIGNGTCQEPSLKHPSAWFTCFGDNPSDHKGLYHFKDTLPGISLPAWQMKRPDEALLMIGCTPPTHRYMGVQTYLLSSGPYPFLFASMGDAVNNFKMNTSATPGGVNAHSNGSAAFSAFSAVVTTASRKTWEQLADSLPKSGIPLNQTNLDVIPDPIALGMGKGFGHGILGNPLFLTIYRNSICEAGEDECKFYRALSWPVLRLRPKVGAPFIPFPLAGYANRTTGVTESGLRQSLDSVLNKTKSAFAVEYNLISESPLLPNFVNGIDCITKYKKSFNAGCLGFTHDAVYFNGDEPLMSADLKSAPQHLGVVPNGPAFKLLDDEVAVLVGINHRFSGKAMYSNLAVYRPSKAMGVLAVIDRQLEGSAAAFGGNNNTYVHAFARSCKGLPLACSAVPSNGFPRIPMHEKVTFVERAYIEPTTLVGPDPKELLAPTVLLFQRAKVFV